MNTLDTIGFIASCGAVARHCTSPSLIASRGLAAELADNNWDTRVRLVLFPTTERG